MIDPVLDYRLSQIQSRIEEDRFLKNNGSGNEIGFWIFDYPAQYELQVREHLKYLLRNLEKDHHFTHLNVFQVIIDMLTERGLFERVCQQEVKVGPEALKKQLAGPLNQKKIADYIAQKVDLPAQEFVILTGMGNAWPLVRGHELMSALQDVMGFTPLLMFYPGTYSGYDLSPLAGIDSRNYYRAFRLVPEHGPAATLNPH
ncbi:MULTISPECIES: DUF1788 domain-containing protein [Enterobacterales]|uniref:DUF1788 domain-containing protein n=1 Tax=Candidatus Pantoea soli TaxID=3098669 RepID=A0A518XF47_9GAMM|nr:MULTISPECIES: DUF1788 domain-containing protein [Enterobacterales]EIX1612860.1 DUF1788 domain-containing protein [Cronobacter sakazakii]ELY3536957.1 DUF1788 domain-containing protein [Cronobacter sakazakii]ELY3593885.1 DUF1788 domain-containing protein [Cronobacter sakazakii]ELY3606030.1 DUF1788 domain-containing protein [Cronobacter sakazakii]ELY4043782.1 DUF1788 domain-containing protein [Cronobacter sakazakii]